MLLLRRAGPVALGVLCVSGTLPNRPVWAQPSRSLHWRALEVRAALDRDGRLRIVERHAMVFTGDWNGGERRFRLGKARRLELHRLRRLDPATGHARDLVPGNPPAADQYLWAAPDLLRWRSRSPHDPPFQATEIVYELDYTVFGALSDRDGRYRLSHEFAFADRPGPIERFTLDLQLDPAWRSLTPFEPHVVLGPLPPGRTHTVLLELEHAGAEPPAAVVPGWPGLRRILLAALLLMPALRLVLLWRGERSRGRFVPLPFWPVNRRWLERNVMSLPAEVVGAAWDRAVGPPEVAATLARLEAEGKVESWVDTSRVPVVKLRLRAPRESLKGYERALMDALLVEGGEVTDAESVRRHYLFTGFDPAAVIRPALEARVREVLDPQDRPGTRAWLSTLLLFAAAVLLLVVAAFREGEARAVLLQVFVTVPVYLIGLAFAHPWRSSVVGRLPIALGVLAAEAGILAVAVLALRGDALVSRAGLAGAVALALACVNSLLNQARSRETARALAMRQRLAAARRFLQDQLHRSPTEIPRAWYPHLVALSLADEAMPWMAVHPPSDDGAPGAGSEAPDSPSSSSSSSSRSSSSTDGLTGGGGRFGGAGATGTWAAAAQAFAISIPAPGSSAGGGSGGDSGGGGGGGASGGGDSGGGGGGGW